MKGKDKQNLDSILSQVDINELVERKKCRPTGKVRFGSAAEANFFVHWLKWRYKRWLKHGRKRRRHGSFDGRPKHRSSYYCPHCKGYHITSKHNKPKSRR